MVPTSHYSVLYGHHSSLGGSTGSRPGNMICGRNQHGFSERSLDENRFMREASPLVEIALVPSILHLRQSTPQVLTDTDWSRN